MRPSTAMVLRLVLPCGNFPPRVARSSRGSGRRPLTPVTRVRIPYGLPTPLSPSFAISTSIRTDLVRPDHRPNALQTAGYACAVAGGQDITISALLGARKSQRRVRGEFRKNRTRERRFSRSGKRPKNWCSRGGKLRKGMKIVNSPVRRIFAETASTRPCGRVFPLLYFRAILNVGGPP